MLEPFVRPSTGKALLVGAILLCVSLAVWNESLTTRSGAVSLAFVMPGFALVAVIRLAGVVAGERAGLGEMPWGYRVASWGVGAGNAFVFGMVDSLLAGLVLGGLIALDAGAALTTRRPGAPVPKMRKIPSGVLLAALAAAVLVGLHFFAVSQFAWWPLFDWGAFVVVASVAFRVMLARPGSAVEDETRPPAAHRVHARNERTLDDPQRERAARAVDDFRRSGDVEPLVTFADDVARIGRLPDHVRRELRSRVPAAAARPGTSRDQDLDAVVAVLERALDERGSAPRQAPVPRPATFETGDTA